MTASTSSSTRAEALGQRSGTATSGGQATAPRSAARASRKSSTTRIDDTASLTIEASPAVPRRPTFIERGPMRASARVGAVLLLALPLLAPRAFAETAASGRQPITHEALWMMKRVGAPVVSPDGRWVVFSVTEPAYDEKKEVSDLWIVSTDGTGTPRRLTSTKAAESGPAWSPDSRFLAFATK